MSQIQLFSTLAVSTSPPDLLSSPRLQHPIPTPLLLHQSTLSSTPTSPKHPPQTPVPSQPCPPPPPTPVTTTYYLPPPSLAQSQPLQPPPSSTTWPPPPPPTTTSDPITLETWGPVYYKPKRRKPPGEQERKVKNGYLEPLSPTSSDSEPDPACEKNPQKKNRSGHGNEPTSTNPAQEMQRERPGYQNPTSSSRARKNATRSRRSSISPPAKAAAA